MIKIITNNFDKKKFNQIAIHPLQSWQWGEARKKMGIEVLRLGEFSENQLKAVYQITFHKIPYTKLKVGYLPRSIFPSKNTLESIYDFCKKNNVIFVKIEPYVFKKQFNNQATERLNNLIISSHPLFPKWTQIIDLTKSEDELLKNMHHKTRYNIRLAQKKGVKVSLMSDEKGFKIFSQLYFETCKRQKYFGHTPNYHKIIWENLKNEIAHLLIAFYKNTPLAAFELFYFKKILYYPYGGTSLQYRNLMASNLLMWEAIRLGKKLGAEKFDLWGSLPPNYNQNHPWSGFTRFKEGYGGKFTEMIGSFDLIINPIFYRFYNILYQIRETYLAFKKLI